MLHLDAEEMHLRRAVSLVVIARLEVARRRVQLVRREHLRSAIDRHAQLAILVRDCVGELRAHGHAAHLRDGLVAALSRVLDNPC
jgi:hypothetical protein